MIFFFFFFFTLFDNSLEVREVFLDISKVFHKVWHDGLKYKLEKNAIKDKLNKRQISFNKLFRKLSTKCSFKLSVITMGKCYYRFFTGISFWTFIVFNLHKRLAKHFNSKLFSWRLFFIVYRKRYHHKHCYSKPSCYKNIWMVSTMENEF